MATYIMLANFSEQGIRNVKDTTKRAEALATLAKKVGGSVKATYWTLGQYDAIAILDAPDEISATAFSLSVGALGNIRTQTLRAFSLEEMGKVLSKIV